MRAPGGTALAGLVAGRTAADIDWPGAHGAAAVADPRRALRRPGSGCARAFPAISPAPWSRQEQSGAGARDPSRGRNHAGILARSDFEKWQRAGGWKKNGDPHRPDAGKGV